MSFVKKVSKTNLRKKKAYDRFYSVLGFLGVFFLAGEFVCPLLSSFGQVLPALFLLVFMLIGYVLQSVWSGITRTERVQSSRGYEQDVKFYDLRKILPVAAVAALPSYAAFRLTDMYLQYLGAQPGGYYDKNSILPAAAFAGVFAVILLGAIVWFFPYDRLLTGKAAFAGWTLSLVAFLIASKKGFILGLMFIGYAVCVMLAMNQSSLFRTYRGSTSEFLTPRMRNANLGLTLTLVPLFAIVCAAGYVMLSGLKTLGLLILAAILRVGRNADYEYDDSDEAIRHVNRFVFDSNDPQRTPDFWYLIIFVAVAATILFMFLTRKHIDFKSFFKRISDWIARMIREIFDPIKYFTTLKVISPDDDENVNYRDEEAQLQDAVIKEYGRKTRTERSYKDFMSDLKERKTQEEKYLFAYSELVRESGRKLTALELSDTPREIAGKINAAKRFDAASVKDITSELERIGYAEQSAGPLTQARLDEVCGMIKDIMH